VSFLSGEREDPTRLLRLAVVATQAEIATHSRRAVAAGPCRNGGVERGGVGANGQPVVLAANRRPQFRENAAVFGLVVRRAVNRREDVEVSVLTTMSASAVRKLLRATGDPICRALRATKS
jgi:hypothetical protein